MDWALYSCRPLKSRSKIDKGKETNYSRTGKFFSISSIFRGIIPDR
jgi:hypothetical protein